MKLKQLLTICLIITVSGTISAQTILPAILNSNTDLVPAGSPYVIQTTTTLPVGGQLTVQPGVEIQMNDLSILVIKGKADFLGTALNPINIHPQTAGHTWGNIFIDSSLNHSTFNYVIIDGATSTPHHYTPGHVFADTNLMRAAFSSYFSSVALNNCTFKNNLQSIFAKYGAFTVSNCSFDSTNVREKINIQFVRNALVENCTFYNTYGPYDMVDFDGIHNGIIRNNIMKNAEDDGVDIGEWEEKPCDSVLVLNNYIEGSLLGKGVSIGERARNVTVEKNVIVGCNIGIAVKDDAHVLIINNTLNADTLGVSVYEKTAPFGGGVATIKNTIIANSILFDVKTDALSTATVSYSLSNTSTLAGTGNLTGNPLFVSIPTKNFHLQAGSPCINTGDPLVAFNDPDNSRNDMGAFFYNPTAIGIQEYVDADGIEIYPNPSNGNIHVKYTSNANTSLINIENICGQTVYSKKHYSSSGAFDEVIDLNTQAKGVYFLHIVTDNKSINKKIIVN